MTVARTVTVLGLFLLPTITSAQWQINNSPDRFSEQTNAVAEIANNNGYKLAIYRDAEGTVHARFTLNDRLMRLHASVCPTFEIDKRGRYNSSVNNAACQLQPQFTEYKLGTIDNNRQLISKPLYDMMNGSTIHYRYRLEAGGYAQTSFSLAGSKRALKSVLGAELEVLPR